MVDEGGRYSAVQQRLCPPSWRPPGRGPNLSQAALAPRVLVGCPSGPTKGVLTVALPHPQHPPTEAQPWKPGSRPQEPWPGSSPPVEATCSRPLCPVGAALGAGFQLTNSDNRCWLRPGPKWTSRGPGGLRRLRRCRQRIIRRGMTASGEVNPGEAKQGRLDSTREASRGWTAQALELGGNGVCASASGHRPRPSPPLPLCLAMPRPFRSALLGLVPAQPSTRTHFPPPAPPSSQTPPYSSHSHIPQTCAPRLGFLPLPNCPAPQPHTGHLFIFCLGRRRTQHLYTSLYLSFAPILLNLLSLLFGRVYYLYTPFSNVN